MHTRILTPLALALCVCTGAAMAQTAAAPAASPAKKELVAKLLKLQQPGIEALARNLVEQPAAQMLSQAGLFLQTRVPPEKRQALAKDIGDDVKAYTAETTPLVRERAIKLAPATAGQVMEDKLSEDELKQVIAMLESPVYAKYMSLSGEMQTPLLQKLVAETRPAVDPKLKALDAAISKRLNAAAGTPAKPAAPATPTK